MCHITQKYIITNTRAPTCSQANCKSEKKYRFPESVGSMDYILKGICVHTCQTTPSPQQCIKQPSQYTPVVSIMGCQFCFCNSGKSSIIFRCVNLLICSPFTTCHPQLLFSTFVFTESFIAVRKCLNEIGIQWKHFISGGSYSV